jgi:GAF domain-containing protein
MTLSRPPDRKEVSAFLAQLREQRERLLSLVRGSEGGEELAQAIDDIGEQLLVADEELRVQTESLSQSHRHFDRLVTAYEELFADAPIAYIQTDADGLVLRLNRAAAVLLQENAVGERSRHLPSLFRSTDRAPVRDMLSRLRAAAAGTTFAAGPPEPLEVAVVRPDGTEVPVILAARRSRGAGAGRVTFHWELQEQSFKPVASQRPVPVFHLTDTQEPVFRAMAQAAVDLARQPSSVEMLPQIVIRARDAVRAADEVSVSLVRGRGRLETPATTGELAAACDRLQYDLREGPCVGAIDDSAPISVSDMASEVRWPRLAPQAAALGVGSLLAVPLIASRGTVGALNFYARRPQAFEPEDELIGQTYATHAGIALAHAELEDNLRTGLATREEIGRAVGILMERHRVTASAAFDMLVVASQQSHRKLRDIAAWMTETGEDPAVLVNRQMRPPPERAVESLGAVTQARSAPSAAGPRSARGRRP